MQNEQVAVTMAYDALNRKSSVTADMDSVKKVVAYGFDAISQRTLMVDPNNVRFTYAYDANGRRTTLVNDYAVTSPVTFSYDDAGHRILTVNGNSMRTSVSYDNAGHLTVISHIRSNGTVNSSFAYQYDDAGNKTSVMDNTGARVTYTLDDVYQLTQEHRTGSHASLSTYTYDPAGNRLVKNVTGSITTYAYNAANQLTTSLDSTGTTTYSYDADGNKTLVLAPSGSRTTTTWDYENKTSLVLLPNGDRNTMTYNADGLRVRLNDSHGLKKFIWDEQRYLQELDSSNNRIAVMVNEPTMYGNLLARRVFAGQPGNGSWTYHYDAQGNTTQITGSGGGTRRTYIYNAWGQVVDEDFDPTAPFINPWQFGGRIGYYTDPNTNSLQIRQRTYKPSIARWWSTDPLGLVDGTNLYILPSLNNYIDPSGMLPYMPELPLGGGRTCRGAPEGIQGVSGRGRFSLVRVFQDAPDLESGRFNMDIEFTWSFRRRDFFSTSGCCCCTKIGFVQIVKSATEYERFALATVWHVDDGIPYSHGNQPTTNPCLDNLSTTNIHMRDRPGTARRTTLGGRLLRHVHDFETCVVCLAGPEGIEFDLNIWEPNLRLGGLTVYGCVRWSYDVVWNPSTGQYTLRTFSSEHDGPSDRFFSVVNRWVESFGPYEGY